MRKNLFLITLAAILSSCGVYIMTVEENLQLLNSDTLKLTYYGETYEIPLKDKAPYYTYEYNIPNIGADTLYSVCRLVMPDIFNSAESVIQMEDANLKTIVGKGMQPQMYTVNQGSIYSNSFTHNVYYTLRIQCYNGKIKISVYNFSSQVPYSFKYTSGVSTNYITDAITKGVDKNKEILDNGYGALIFAIGDTGQGVINLFVETAEKYLKENFNL